MRGSSSSPAADVAVTDGPRGPHDRDGAARQEAAAIVARLRSHHPGILELRGADLGAALEQQFFFQLRAGDLAAAATGRFDGLRAWVRVAGIAGAGMTALLRRPPPPGVVVAMVRQPVHVDALAGIDEELRRQGGPRVHTVRIGPAARQTPPQPGPLQGPAIFEVMDPRLAPSLAAHQRRVLRLRPSPAAPPAIAAFTRRELPRIAAGAIGVESVIRRYRPSLLVSFDEIGTWARLIPAVARRAGVPTLDLPHAEAADAVAISGAGYDAFAVYGPRARQVLLAAGVRPERIHAIGAPRFDPLIAAAREEIAPGSRRAVLFAAQYVTGRLTAEVLTATYRAALAAAGATDSPLDVVPHPAQPPGTIERLMAENPAPAGVRVRTADGGLHAALAASWLLVTGWSNSVMEAAIAGIPSITVNPGGVSPVDFAADGLSTGATGERDAAAAAVALRDPGHARDALNRARGTLADRLGPLDGRASERAATLIRSLALAAGHAPNAHR